MRNNTDIYDVMRCPDCDSEDCYSYDTDEIEFDVGGTGHYYVDCHCRNCGNTFRLYTEFEYSITKAYTR